MTARDGLLGLVLAAAGAGVAGAAPPMAEGREPDPVAREFYAAEPAAFGYAAGPAPAAKPAVGSWVVAVWGVLLDRMTVPLGTVPVTVWD
jgi:hypothetical protein